MGVVPRKAFIIVRKSRKVLQKLCTCTPFATLPQLPLPLPLYYPLPLPAVCVCVCANAQNMFAFRGLTS